MLEWLTQRALPDLDWNYALITLVVRFIAVFFVLWMIQAAMQLSAYFINRGKEGAPAGSGGGHASPQPAGGTVSTDGTPDDMTLAAIAVALELESHPEATTVATERRTSAWAVAGRNSKQPHRR